MAVQLLNAPERCVDDALEGMAALHPGLYLIPNKRLIVERDRIIEGSRKRLALVSGGGSGHEPFSAGYVGRGMLGGAVAGPVFTSPPTGLIANAIATLGTDNPDGVLVIVFNYTGDRVNFGQAVERCKAAGFKVDMYISGDDCALTRLEGTAGRRGLCGTIFIFKIVGAMAEAGASLEEALTACRKIGGSIGTIGVAASGCTLPGAQSPLFSVPQGKLELGLGVHGEAGAKTIKAGSAKEVVECLLNHMTREDSASRLDLNKGDEVAVLVSNLGSVSQLEMGVITKEVTEQLKARGVRPLRVYQGLVMTSLDMKGFHISILQLVDPHWVALLDEPTSAPSWPKRCVPLEDPLAPVKLPSFSLDISQKQMANSYSLEDKTTCDAFRSCLEAVVKTVPKYEDMLNRLDTGCGDGDCGSTLLAGINALSGQLSGLPFSSPGRVLAIISDIANTSMGGTSGGLYSILFTAAANSLLSTTSRRHHEVWTSALKVGLQAVSKYGGASVGDRTMLDALTPALETLESCEREEDLKIILKAMSHAADEGAKKTACMKARAGRASYVREENVVGEDAGARSVACVLQAMAMW
ncbi:triokinase/FMN cyclase-like [Palaemon carinicauda]|uniref:triokinase/FMN cyclase-like n=1 Tax=Palaemon carinicauda TaxID=392227 RepID=UPI0035B673B1